jgi:HEAT repeat protein
MPRITLASQITALRARFDAGGSSEKKEIAGELWGLCLQSGAAARVALPWLRELAVLRDQQIVQYATHALGRAGEQGLRALRKLLGHSREIVRCNAAYGLSEAGDTSPATLDPLAKMLRARSAAERAAALGALGKIVEISERRGILAPYAGQIVAALDGANAAVRTYAPEAVAGIFRSPKKFVEFALARLDQPRGRVRFELVGALVERLENLDARPYLPTLLRILRANPQLASSFLGPLAQAGREALDMVPVLEELASGDSLEALRAGGALLRIDGRQDVLGKLAKRLPESPDEIAGILCEMGPAAAPVAGVLAHVIDESFDEPDWDLMWALTDALAAIESPEPVAIRALRKSLSHESGRVKGSALNGLRKLGPAARAALPDLCKLLDGMSGESRQVVRETIRAIGKPAN